ncbi:MAG: CheR family methyltransferase [Chloroflexia bacterium]
MGFYRETLGLSDSAFMLLRDLIHERTGLYFDDGKRELLGDKVAPRLIELGVESFLDYYYYLKYDEGDEWGHLMDALAVPETFFWREMDQVQALVEVLVPEYVANGRPAPMRIWSAACSSGEEPLSIAIALSEAGWFERFPVEIHASDASPAAIARARRGIYRERSFRALPLGLRSKYFRKEAEGWRICPEIHGRIQWHIANLADPKAIAPLAGAPFIFCRNVFIYFSPEAIRRTVGCFVRHMPRPGYLFLGASESLLRVTTELELEQVGTAMVYVKR